MNAGLEPLVLQGNVLDVLRTLPQGSVQCVVTSPPFWGLRRYDLCGCAQDYVRGETGMPRFADGPIREKAADPNCRWCHGTGKIPGMDTEWGGRRDCEHEWEATPPRRPRSADDATRPVQQGNRGAAYDAVGGRVCRKCSCWVGALGLEPTVGLYLEHLVGVFHELRRVLRDTGVAWVEIGDSFSTHPAGLTGLKRWKASTLSNRDNTGAEQAGSIDRRSNGLREKNLSLVPCRLAIALQDEGWIVRSVVVWNRPNPMPESIRDRPAQAHSYILMLAKEPRYFYDAEAVREGAVGGHSWGNRSIRKVGDEESNIRSKPSWYESMSYQVPSGGSRNLRSVWTIPSQAYPGSHFAVFPERIPEIAILAGTSEKGACPECGAPWKRIVGRSNPSLEEAGPSTRGWANTHQQTSNPQSVESLHRNDGGVYSSAVTAGWAPTCACYPDPCDRCHRPWVRQNAVQKASTFNVRVRDAKAGILGQKSGLGGEVADATEEEMDAYEGGASAASSPYRLREVEVAWPGCACRRPLPCVVLDLFAGSGTTLAVAKRLGRRSIGIELSPAYIALIRERVAEARTETARHPGQRRLMEFVEEA